MLTRHLPIALLATLVLVPACRPEPERIDWPEGHWILGDVAALSPVVRGLSELAGTPIERHARAWLDRLAECDGFVVHADREASADAWIEGARCAEGVEIPVVLEARRAGAAAAFSLSLHEGQHIHGSVTVDEGGRHRIEAVFEGDPNEGASAASLLVQGDAPAGVPVFAAEDSLIHARVRPAGGLDLASLVSQGSQADHMFHLRSELFVGALLEGSFELAIYLPRSDQVTPPMALALDHSLRAGAERAMQTFVSELESTWPIHHANQRIAGEEGACFHDLKLLPDLVPCYVVTERSIVIGWNPTSIELALGRSREAPVFASGPALDETGGWLIHLDRFPEADVRLQRQLAGATPPVGLAGLFDWLRVDARHSGEDVKLEAEFVRHARVGASR